MCIWMRHKSYLLDGHLRSSQCSEDSGIKYHLTGAIWSKLTCTATTQNWKKECVSLKGTILSQNNCFNIFNINANS